MKRALAVGAVVILASVPARAEDRAAAAQALFDQAKALVEAGRFAEACPKLAASMKLDPGTGTSLWLADCYENEGKTASAWAQFKEAAASAALAGDPREKVARERAAALAPKLPRLTVVLPKAAEVPGLAVTRDDVVVSRAELGVALPVDPGVHTVGATAPGHKAWSQKITVAAGPSRLAVTVPTLEEDAAAPGAPPPSAVTVPSEDEGARGWGAQRWIGVTVAGAGVVGLGLGALLGLGAKSTYDRATDEGHCLRDNRCDARGRELREGAEDKATVATVVFVAAAAAVAAGAVLYVTAPKKSATTAWIAPLPTGAAFGATF